MFSKNKSLIISFTIACSTLGCAAPRSSVKTSVYAPAEIGDAFLTNSELVNPDTTSQLTLEQIFTFADTHSPVVKKAKAKARLGDADIIGADIFFPENPEVEFVIGKRLENETTGVDIEIGVEQAFEIGGQRGRRVEAAEARKRHALASVNEVRWDLHSRLHNVFIGLLLVKERKAQALQFADFSKTLRDTITKQIEFGESSPLELLVADADLAQTTEAIIEAENLELSLMNQLKTLMGWPNDSLTISGELHSIKASPSIETLFTLMRDHHPALRTRELAVVAKVKELEVEDREGWIDPRLGLTYGRKSSQDNGSDVVTFNLILPLAIWRTNEEGKARALTAIDIAGQEREITIQRLRLSLREAKLNVDGALKSIQVYEEGVVPQLEKSLNLLKKAYELGEVSIQEVSQTQQRLLNATARYTNAKIKYYESAIDLSAMVGTEVFDTPRNQSRESLKNSSDNAESKK